MATFTLPVCPSHNQPPAEFPPVFFTTQQLRLLSDLCGILVADSSSINLVFVPGGAMWIPR